MSPTLALKQAVLFSLALVAGVPTAWADSWPTKPIQLIVVFPPGGSADQMGRLLAPHLSEKLGQNVVVENRSGAGGMIGTNFVSKGDDHTFGVVFDTHATNVHSLKETMPFDVMKDITYVSLLGTAPLAIFSNPKSGYTDFGKLIAASKKKTPVSYGTVGTGGLSHLAMVSLAKQGGFDWQNIAYRGGGPMHTAVAANHVPIGIASLLAIKGLADGGTVIPLAVTTSKRSPIFPNVPTVAESGYEGFEAPTWWGVVASRQTSEPIAQKMSEAIASVLRIPEVAAKLKSQGVEVAGTTPAQFRTFVQQQIDMWGKVIRENNIKAGD